MKNNFANIRIGHGFDVHAFGAARPLILGGVTIPYTRGLVAHSDGDVVIHALCDALLGAAGLGDIGHHFPDNDARYRDINSRLLLRQVMLLTQKKQFQVINIDISIIAQEPKLASYIPAMRAHFAHDLHIAESAVNLKATTTERLGYIGRGEGIAVHAVCLLLATGVSAD